MRVGDKTQMGYCDWGIKRGIANADGGQNAIWLVEFQGHIWLVEFHSITKNILTLFQRLSSF